MIAIEIAVRYIVSNLPDLFANISTEIKPYCFDKCSPEIERNSVINAVYNVIIRFERLAIKFEFKVTILKKLVKNTIDSDTIMKILVLIIFASIASSTPRPIY